MGNYERLLAVLKEVEPYVSYLFVGYGEYFGREGKQMRVDFQFASVELEEYWKKELGEREPEWSIVYPYLNLIEETPSVCRIYIPLSEEEYEEASRKEAEESCLTITKYSKS
jgi:hypothetical protein